MISVTYFFREPRKTGVSIEGIFHAVSCCLSGKIIIKNCYFDPGLSRVKNTLRASKCASDINHITGDVNFMAIGLRSKKTVLTIHDFGFYENPVHSKMVKLIYHLFWLYLPLKFTDKVTVVSEFTKNKLIKYFKYPEEKIRVIPNPVKNIFRFSQKQRNSHPMVILMMGTGKHKNLTNLIEASKQISLHLDIIGWPAPDELALLKAYQISYSVYNGLSDEQVYERYVACDVLFMASLYEGFGMPIIEAQAVGRPVITSNIGAMLEVANGTALLVNPHRPDEIRAAILSLEDAKLYDELVVKGRANADKYKPEVIADQYLEVYKELAAK